MANQPHEISPEIRQFFDEHVEFVVAELPQQVTDFMERVPLFVEDYPSPQVMRKMRIRHPANLLGLYSGVPLIERSVDQTRMMSDVIHIYRLGILSSSQVEDWFDQRGGIAQANSENHSARVWAPCGS